MALTVVWLFTTVFTCVHLSVLLEEEYRFKQWMSEHNKVYDTEEYYRRFHVFTENKKTIDRHNAGNHTFTMGLNQFSDMTFEEFRKLFLLTEPQGHCGSCWTFSTTGCLESVNAIATGKLIPLSEQQLIDCAKDFNNHGCLGGLPSQAFEYIKYNKGLMTEEDYPYKGHDDSCHFEPALAAAFVLDTMNITSYDEKAMVDAVARLNPVSFAFEVSADFVHYKEGVYTSTQCKNTADKVNHAVLAVGYGAEENDTPYWIVKNSWGTAWGIDGYFLIERGKNMCGLAVCSSYPLPLV
ncbi:pro-cathepsin H-like isoform X1 [Dicentrarchus labrax]|uniref:pro-cathepsin H-like isoform X1 n=1 Tax=Dicentrarchus labrax TaxID=13489 RepID=UPI0021F5793E|nr:pro-cathepsin H-like isoform X1 [Dicentrarchus labrax]